MSKREADGGAEVVTAPNMTPTRIPEGTEIIRILTISDGGSDAAGCGGCGGGGDGW